MSSLLDIGIDINSIMEICIPKNSQLPFEFECEIVMRETNELSLYEGNRFYVKDNHKLGQYTIPFKTFIFKLKMNTDFKLKVFMNDDKLDEIQCKNNNELRENNETNETNNDNELRELKQAKDDFRDYIISSTSSIDEIPLEKDIKDFILDRLNWAKDVLDIEDVTCEEYRLALQEIENIVNPLLKPYLNKPIYENQLINV
jgi:hypothetical protein